MTLDEFEQEVLRALAIFKAEYLEHNAANPEHYPLELPENQNGLWWEFLLSTGE